MQHIYQSFPTYSERRFSICDSQIAQIGVESDCVRFYFPDGFFYIDHNQIKRIDSGYVEIGSCNAEEFSCYVFDREISANGAVLLGKPISLTELKQTLLRTGAKLEVYLELYDFDYLYWRCTLVPNHSDGLSSRIDIEVSGQFPLAYHWE